MQQVNRLARLEITLGGLVVVGIGLRFWQYCGDTALWMDEIALARNVLERPSWKLLTEPLAYDQTAPSGFLLIEKIAVLSLGSSDDVLRFFPFVASLVALITFWRIVLREMKNLSGLIALAFFATA